MTIRNDRVELTADVEALSVRSRRGERGSVEEVHAGGYLTVRMDNGRPQFPRCDEVDVLPRT
ncbi:hypothetical protein [Streptomyces sp. NBC_00470]|uniref:hypothetical protein n=1 Tax=Streptomyces sp. NBC_00470 TaxID=2975753 RepID=UPI002F919A0C